MAQRSIPRPVNPFVGGLPVGDIAPLMSPTPIARQNVPMSPLMAPQLGGGMMSPQPMGPPSSFGDFLPIPGMGGAMGASASPAPEAAPMGFGQRLNSFLGGDEALAFASGLLSGGSTNQAVSQGFSNAYNARRQANPVTSSADLQLYAAAKREGYQGGLMDFLKEKDARDAGADLGLNPVYYYDENGDIRAGQVGKDGRFKPIEVPGGGSVLSPGEKAADSAAGKKIGELAVNLPSVENSASRMLGTIDSLLQDPALPSVTGAIEGRLPPFTGDRARAQSKIDQILGGTFLQAFNDLRGGGQITEAEGSKATAAYARLSSQIMNDQDYRQALLEFRDELIRLVEIARQKAGGMQTGIQQNNMPAAGSFGGSSDPLGIR